jgi:hypothetical protein
VDGTQRCRGNSTVWLLLYTMHVVMIIWTSSSSWSPFRGVCGAHDV